MVDYENTFASALQEIFTSITKISILKGRLGEDWVEAYHSMNFRDFPHFSKFAKVLSLKTFRNS